MSIYPILDQKTWEKVILKSYVFYYHRDLQQLVYDKPNIVERLIEKLDFYFGCLFNFFKKKAKYE